MIRCYFRRFFRELSQGFVDRIADTPQTANPLFLRAVLEELRVHGEFERLPDQISVYLQIETIPKLYEAILERYEHDFERYRPGLVRDLCRLLWASRRGLSRAELGELLGDGTQPLPDAHWAPLLLAMQHGLVEKGDVLTFFHDHLREAARARYLPDEADVASAHLDHAGYFENQGDSPRRLEEFPWQLAAAGAWDRLVGLLTDPAFFSALYRARKYDLRQYWVQAEEKSSHRVAAAYAAVAGDASFDDDGRNRVAFLLMNMGHPAEAGRIWETMTAGATDPFVRQAWLGNQALILKARGDLDGAMRLHKEEERICRELGNVDGLQASLGNQALILYARSDLDGAMKLYYEQEGICRGFGNVEGLAISLENQSLILDDLGRLEEAKRYIDEAYTLATNAGYATLVEHIKHNKRAMGFK